MMWVRKLLLAGMLLGWCLSAGAANLVDNGGFEKTAKDSPEGWSELWTRDAGRGQAVLDRRVRHSGDYSVRIEHAGEQDWSFTSNKRLDVKRGDIFTIQGWVKVEGTGSATIGAIAYDESGTAVDWVLGGRTACGTSGWRLLRGRFVIPSGVETILPRLMGRGPATVWFDDFSVERQGNLSEMQAGDGRLTVENGAISLTIDTASASLSVTDKRTNHLWRQQPSDKVTVLGAERTGGSIKMTLLDQPSGMDIGVVVRIEKDQPEFTVTLSGEGEMETALQFPSPFVSEAGTYLVVPMNEGISYPVEDKTINPMRLIAYGGHGICMGFWGVTDDKQGHMAIIETPDDASIRIKRAVGKLCIGPEWDSQKGQFGYARKLRYVFFDKGGHTAIAKRYRRYAIEKGLLKTLTEKRKENPNVDLLVGAVNVWCWEKNSLGIVREMKAAGIDRILWSHRGSPQIIAAMNNMPGVLTSRYDIYQDLMDPQIVKEKLRGSHPDWTQDAWPDDIMIDSRGDWRKGWRVTGKDGQMYPCAVLCDRQAVEYAKRRVPAELKTNPYRCRFIDTTTASPWRECYDPDHPMTRSDSRYWKMQLLRYMSEDMKLVTGSETGHDAAVRYVHYFEGMLSLGPYRVPNAGRDMRRIWMEVPERVAKFQTGHRYRLPLWELVYHDCVIAQWYWGDYNNKLPALWDKRDLFNILYGTPGMFMFTREYWNDNKERFVQSYRDVCSVARAVGYSEMLDHRFLTSDRDVQQTHFANGAMVTVNFGDRPYVLANGVELEPMSFEMTGL